VTVTRSVILGCGSYLPTRVLTNDDLAKMVDTSDEWIFDRTGIKRRHIASEGEMTSDLALEAAKRALKHADTAVSEIDLIVVATTTPDETFPSTATKIQARLGMIRGAAFDVQAVCSGFIYGLSVGDNFIRAGQAKTVLVIGAETMSRILDWNDRGTCVLFGDGAGAVVLSAAEDEGTNKDRGILNTRIFSDGRLHDLLYTDGGVVTNIANAIQQSTDAAGLTPHDIDWFVPHQANQRILDGTARKVGISPDRVISTIAEHGNTSAASVPLALCTAVQDGRIKRGDLVLMEAMGGGFTWGAALVRW
jgi:3-oxoacyl-[acyl-carrier-protein] synthase-3